MKSAFPRVLLVLVFLALVANVVVTAVKGQSFITRDMVFKLVFFGLVVANLSICGAALYFTSKAHQKNERSALKWSQRGFIANVVVTLNVGTFPWILLDQGKPLSMRMLDTAFILLFFGASNGIFAYGAYRDYVRAVGSHGSALESRRRRKVVHRAKPEDAEASWEE